MTGDQFDAQGEAHEALSTAVTSYGARVLSDPRILGNLVTDLLPDAPRERSLLVTAAEAGVASELSQHVEQEHLNVETAIAMVARGLTESRSIDLAASTWVATEYAQALGYQARSASARSAPPPAQFGAGPAPMTDTVRRPRYSPQPEPFGAPQSPVTPPLPPPQSPAATPRSPVTPPFPQPSQAPAPTVWSPTPTMPHPGAAVPPASPGYPGPATPPGSAVPPMAFPYAQAPGPYAGYPAPSFPGPAGTGLKRKRKTAIIAGVSGAVVLAGCVALVIALLPGPAPKPPVHRPSVVLSGASEVATFTPPNGGTFSGTFFSPDGTLFAAQGGTDHKTDVYVFSATTHKYVDTVKAASGDDIYPFSITPDDQYMIAGVCTSSACNIYEYTISSGRHGSGVSVPSASFAVNDDGTTEANETLNAKFIDVWNLQSGKFTGHFRNPTTSPIVEDSLYVSADGSEMLVSAVNGKAYVMSARTGQTLATIPYHAPSNPRNPGSRPLPQLSPDGKTAYIPGSGSTPPQIWSVATGANVTPTASLWPKTDNGLGYSTDGTVAVTSPANAPFIDVWNVDLGSHVTRATIPGSNDWAIDGVGPSGNEVLFGSKPNSKGDSARLFLYSVP